MLILVMMMAMTTPPPATTMMCKPSPPRGPSLVLVDAKGKCPAGTEARNDKSGKTLYCVNTKHQPPTVCQPVNLPAATAAPAKKK